MSEEHLIIGTTETIRTLQNGDLIVRVKIDSETEISKAFQAFARPKQIAIAVISDHRQVEKPHAAYVSGLHKSGFFRNPDLHRAVGSDEEFLAFVRTMPCIICKGEAEAAHVRSADNSGIAIKPEYSAIPLCPHHHRDVQHTKGICELTGEREIQDARDKLQRWKMIALEKWAYHGLAELFGVDSVAQVDPAILKEFCRTHNVFIPD